MGGQCYVGGGGGGHVMWGANMLCVGGHNGGIMLHLASTKWDKSGISQRINFIAL